jgi:hypothetical protein
MPKSPILGKLTLDSILFLARLGIPLAYKDSFGG